MIYGYPIRLFCLPASQTEHDKKERKYLFYWAQTYKRHLL